MIYIFKRRKSILLKDQFFRSQWNPVKSHKGKGEKKNLILECFKSNVCLLYTFVLHYRAQFDNYMFRKTFSCSRAIRNFEIVDKVFSVCTESPTYEKLLCTGNCFAVLSFHVDTIQLGLSEGRAAFMLWGPDTCPASVALRVSLARSVLGLQ